MDGKISNLAQICSVRRYTVSDGAEKGLEFIDCDNGKMRILLNVSKALDISQAYYKGQNISFISKNGFSGREIPFPERFEGGMLYTCGLDSVGARDGFELHGTHHNHPANVETVKCDENGIYVEATVRESALFGKNLLFRRKVVMALNSCTVEITDCLENTGFKEENYCLLYHVNAGYPLLDENATLYCDTEDVKPRTAWAEKNISSRSKMTDSVVGQEEMCYYLKAKEGIASLVNEKSNKKFTLTWSKDSLPCLIEWKSMASGDYALGIEPCTTELDKNFRYSIIKPGETAKFSLTISMSEIVSRL